MEYHELYKEYTSLLNDKTDCIKQLAVLKNGYISTKTISGKKYAYLQYRVDGKLMSEYVKDEYLQEVRAELKNRANLIERISETDDRLGKIEAAAGILDSEFRRKLVTLHRCAKMEALPFDERKKSLAFGRAMTALEGSPVSKETERNLSLWASGNYSFQESYLNTLRTYNLAEG